MLNHLRTRNIGWAKNIIDKLTTYELETNWDNIKNKSKREWKRVVEKAVDDFNRNKLMTRCTSKTAEGTRVNTKTKSIYNDLLADNYQRKVLNEFNGCTKYRTKLIILSRNGMLECGANFKGTMSEVCSVCAVVDNENHRINDCTVLSEVNQANCSEKYSFGDISKRNSNKRDKYFYDVNAKTKQKLSRS